VGAMTALFLFTTMSRPALWPIHPPTQWVPETVMLGVKQMGHEADHSPIISAKVKNAWSYTTISQYAFMEW